MFSPADRIQFALLCTAFGAILLAFIAIFAVSRDTSEPVARAMLLAVSLLVLGSTLALTAWAYHLAAAPRPVERPHPSAPDLQETELQQALSMLSRSSREVERFAYIASHDLQEPVRQIANHVSLIERRYAHVLDGDGLRYLDFAVSGAKRLQSLITALLEYSTLGTEPMRHTRFPLARPLQSAIARLPELAHGAIRQSPLPEVTGDPKRIERVFDALLSNCVKFRRREVPLQIEISARQSGIFWELCIRDNGMGFDQRYEDKIFEVFGRLNGPTQFAGTGMGLAVVRRIIEDHGGSVGVLSTPGLGTEFTLTLPIADPFQKTAYEHPFLAHSSRR